MNKLSYLKKFVWFFLVLALSACSVVPPTSPAVLPQPQNSPVPPQPTHANLSDPTQAQMMPVSFLKSDKPRSSVDQVSPEDIHALAAGNSAFALDLYKLLKKSDGNLFLSPYSISLALAMTEAGARGDTQSAMDQTLHFTLPEDRLHPAFNALDQAIADEAKQDAAGDQGQGFSLNVANSIWGQSSYPFSQPYLDLLSQNYGAGMRVTISMPIRKPPVNPSMTGLASRLRTKSKT